MSEKPLPTRIREALERVTVGDFHDPGDVLALAAEAADALESHESVVDWWSEGIQHLKCLFNALAESPAARAIPKVADAYRAADVWFADTETIRRERPDGRLRG